MNFEDWSNYVSCFSTNFESCTFKDELIKKCCGNEDIAIAIYYHCRNNALKWMDSAVPALANKIPSMEISAGNVNAVREVIWRFPC